MSTEIYRRDRSHVYRIIWGPVQAEDAPDDGLRVTLAKWASDLGVPALYGVLHLSDLSKRLLLGIRGRSRRALEAAVWAHSPVPG